MALAAVLWLSLAAAAQTLPTEPAQASRGATTAAFDGVVEAVRQTVVAAQVSGAVVGLEAKAGDRVKAGQVLLRIDARAADQNAAATEAQVQAARATLEVASKDYARQQRLYDLHFISQAALEQAEAAFKATRAQANAQIAQAGAARTQSNFYVVRAPFAGVIAEVPVAIGDMAMPGRSLLTLYDPSELRVTAAVPQSVAARLPKGQPPRIMVPGLTRTDGGATWLVPVSFELLPTADVATHTVTLRADLPKASGAAPGLFARLWLTFDAALDASAGSGSASVSVRREAVVRRAEMTGLYVLDANGKPVLRQVRLGPAAGDRIEVLSGVMPGERVVTDPQAAARATVQP